MRNLFFALLCVLSCALPGFGQNPSSNPESLLDHLAGDWVLHGTIGGKQTTHDVHAQWILRREYLQLHEISREKSASGDPAYEAFILISWNAKANKYACLWLDSTEGGALTSSVTCRAVPAPDSIPFIFIVSQADAIHTTFTYCKASDTWQWIIDNIAGGKPKRFATLELSRAR